MKLFKFGVLLAVLTLSGCATSMEEAGRIVGNSAPYHYKMGFSHGCDSGMAAIDFGFSVHKKDFALARSNKDYSSGWNEGYIYCRDKYSSW